MIRLALVIPVLLSSAGYVPENRLALTITVYTIDNRRLWTYALDMTSVSVTRHSLVREPDRLVHRRDLTLNEIKKLDRFLARYPFDSLEKYYINERVHGDTGTVYRVMLNRNAKDCYVYYARPEKVLELNRFINRLLPREYRLWDEKM